MNDPINHTNSGGKECTSVMVGSTLTVNCYYSNPFVAVFGFDCQLPYAWRVRLTNHSGIRERSMQPDFISNSNTLDHIPLHEIWHLVRPDDTEHIDDSNKQ